MLDIPPGTQTTAVLAHVLEPQLTPDPARVIPRLFLPGEELISGRSRVGALIDRVLALPEEEVQAEVDILLQEFSARHRHFAQTLAGHASMVEMQLQQATPISPARTLMMGACFTAEYSVEGAALCNPSAVPHPDQTGLAEGQIRVAVSVRGIGEGHLSSIGFVEALVGPGPNWAFQPRQLPAVAGSSSPTSMRRVHLRAAMRDTGPLEGVTRSLLAALPNEFTAGEFQHALANVHPGLLAAPGALATVDALLRLVFTAYQVNFPDDVTLSQMVLMPSTPQENKGVEDTRLVQFTQADGTIEYRGTYTAYDGQRIAPRLLTSPDLRYFRAQSMAGPAAHNKGMALFPRLIDGQHWSLCRADGESTGVATSKDGVIWSASRTIQIPDAAWGLLQVGNCGPPMETDQGWLVLTHVVGPMRVYSIGALLLDLDDPTRIVKRLRIPLLQATSTDRNGYVPNVVYSCGGIIHDGLLWIPHGIGDTRIGIAWVEVAELLGKMS